jgi:hypothetical protein
VNLLAEWERRGMSRTRKRPDPGTGPGYALGTFGLNYGRGSRSRLSPAVWMTGA